MKEERCLWSEDVIVGLGEAENQPGKLRPRWRWGEELEVQKESALKRSLFKRHYQSSVLEIPRTKGNRKPALSQATLVKLQAPWLPNNHILKCPTCFILHWAPQIVNWTYYLSTLSISFRSTKKHPPLKTKEMWAIIYPSVLFEDSRDFKMHIFTTVIKLRAGTCH